jgi:ELWxxDGT repeat protein
MKNLLLCITILMSAITAQAQISLVSDINPTGNSYPFFLQEMNGKLYFTADDGVNGNELWIYNPTTGIAQMVADIGPGNWDGLGSFTFTGYNSSECFAVLNDKLYFCAHDLSGNGRELWRYDGVNAPTMVADLYPGIGSSDPFEFVTLNNKLYFTANSLINGTGELWVYDPATNIAEVVTNINIAGSGSSLINSKVVFNNKIYFCSNYDSDGAELFVYDPSNNSTSQVADIVPGVNGSNPSYLTVANNTLYFMATTPAYGKEIYSYTGTGSPIRLTDIASGPANSINLIGEKPFNNKLLLNATDGVNGYEFYAMDLMTNTVQLVYDMQPGSLDGSPVNFTAYAGKIYFVGTKIGSGYELWVYDGTNQPTMVYDLMPGISDGVAGYLTVVNDTMYMCAQNATTGWELFRMYDVAVSVGEHYKEVSVVSYPVPASEAAHIRITTPATLTCSVAVYDITGKVVFEKAMANYVQGTSEIEVPMSGMATGNYIYKLTDKTGEVFATGKIVKQ